MTMSLENKMLVAKIANIVIFKYSSNEDVLNPRKNKLGNLSKDREHMNLNIIA